MPLPDEDGIHHEDELHDLQVMAELIREGLGLPVTASVAQITASARTAILLMKAEEAFQTSRAA